MQNPSSLHYSLSHSSNHPPLSLITLKSIQIVKPQIDTTCYKKLNISIILPKLNDQQRKLIRYLSTKFSTNLYNEWEQFWNKQKEFSIIQSHKGKTCTIAQGQLIILNETSIIKLSRELKLNPTLRVILLVQNMEEFILKEQHSFVLVTSSCQEIKQYLTKHKNRLIKTSKN